VMSSTEMNNSRGLLNPQEVIFDGSLSLFLFLKNSFVNEFTLDIYEISQLLETGLEREVLPIVVALIEEGLNPEGFSSFQTFPFLFI